MWSADASWWLVSFGSLKGKFGLALVNLAGWLVLWLPQGQNKQQKEYSLPFTGGTKKKSTERAGEGFPPLVSLVGWRSQQLYFNQYTQPLDPISAI